MFQAVSVNVTTSGTDNAVLMFVALFTLYSPLSSVASYMPIVGHYRPAEQRRLAAGLFVYVAVFVLGAIWVGEVLLAVLGISTAALTTAGGVALVSHAVPLMLNRQRAATTTDGAGASSGRERSDGRDEGWRSTLLLPLTFPLTVGGATFAILVGFAAATHGVRDRGLLTAAGLAYAAVTGVTLYVSAHVHRYASPRARDMIDRIAGIILTSIAAMLLASGITRLVTGVLHGLR